MVLGSWALLKKHSSDCRAQFERLADPDGLLFKHAMEALQFSIGVRIVGRGQPMAGLPEADKLPEVARDELAAPQAADRGRICHPTQSRFNEKTLFVKKVPKF